MKKITFENKSSSLNIDSKYIITSENVNEIKDVINNISDIIEEWKLSDKLKYKYIFITLPKSISKNYDLEVELSNSNWTDGLEIRILKLSLNPEKFLIFEDGNFNNLTNNYISSSESGKILIIDIQTLLTNVRNINCRFRFKNNLSNSYTDYFSMDLYPNAKINEKPLNKVSFFTIPDLKYKNHIINLLNIRF